jgi:hypothetical protein
MKQTIIQLYCNFIVCQFNPILTAMEFKEPHFLKQK